MDTSGSQRKNILLIGRRGRGKSSVGNLLLHGVNWDQPTFGVSHFGNSTRTTHGFYRSSNKVNLYIHDTTGFDSTISKSQVIEEVKGIIQSIGSIHGVLFVMQHGRLDDWDKAVFMLYLQFLLSGVPNSMVGLIVTRSPVAYIASNDPVEWYNSHNDECAEKIFLQMLLERCEYKACFIDNPDPAEEVPSIVDLSKLRELSLNSITKVIDQLHGSFTFDGIGNTLLANLKQMVKYVNENKLSVAVSVVGFLVTVVGGIATILSQR